MNRFLMMILLITWVTTSAIQSQAQVPTESTVDPAAKPPKRPSSPQQETVHTTISGRLRSEMYFSQKPRMHYLGNGQYRVEKLTVIPFYEYVELRATEVGHKGLSIHFKGWSGFDIADVYFSNRFVADPTYLYLQFNDYGADIKLGRQQVYTGVFRGLHLDGINAAYQTPLNIGFQGLAGFVVSPKWGPDWYTENYSQVPEALNFDDFAGGLSQWDRKSNFATGGRVFYKQGNRISTGISFLNITQHSDNETQLVGGDISLLPTHWLSITGNGAFDVLAKSLQEANLGADFYPTNKVSIGVDYRHANPTLYISHLSIFSVFSTEEYDSVGGSFRIRPIDQLTFRFVYHQNFYSFIEKRNPDGYPVYDDQVAYGYDLDAGGTLRFGSRYDHLILFNFRRLKESQQGIVQFRLGSTIPIIAPMLKVSGDFYWDIYDTEINDQKRAFLGDLGIFYISNKILLGGNFSAGQNPYANSEIKGMVKFEYNFDVTFVRHVK